MRILGLFTCLAVSLFADQVTTQEGGYWVRTTTEVPIIPTQTKLVVSSRGSVILKGTSERPALRLTQKVRAHSEEEAQRLFGDVGIIARTMNGVTRIVVSSGASPLVSTQLQLAVPRQIPMSVVETQGTIEAYDLDGVVDVSTIAGNIRIDRVHGAVTSQTGGGEIRIGKLGGSLKCGNGGGNIYVDSTGGDTTCETAGGDITVKKSGGKLALSTEGGNISVEDAASDVDARSGEGVIEVLQALGIVNATTMGGSIQVGSARGVRAESAAGQVRLKGTSGPLRVSTAAGSILAELFMGMPLEDSSFVSGRGDITILIPSNLAVSVLATNQSGGPRRIISDFSEFRVRNPGLLQPPMLAQGSINGGGPILNLSAASGVIYLRRK